MATAIWALSQLIKTPNSEMISFIENIQSDHPDVVAERAAFLEMVLELQV